MRIELPSGTAAEVAGESHDRGLVVVPDIMGLRSLFDDLVASLANTWQCRVVAFELFAGQEDLDLQGRFAKASSLKDHKILGDMVAAADLTNASRVAAIGFCMGGMYVNKAVSTARFARLVSFYGMIRVPTDWQGADQGEPLAHLSKGEPSSLLAILGTADSYTPQADVAELQQCGVRVVQYAGAEHGFVHDPTRPTHHPDHAADAWEQASRWLWSEPQNSW